MKYVKSTFFNEHLQVTYTIFGFKNLLHSKEMIVKYNINIFFGLFKHYATIPIQDMLVTVFYYLLKKKMCSTIKWSELNS